MPEQPKPRKTPGKKPERLKIEGDPVEQFRKLLQPQEPEKRKEPRRKTGSGR